MGGRIEDRDVRVAGGDGFAAAARDWPRCALSTDSRQEVSAQAELELLV